MKKIIIALLFINFCTAQNSKHTLVWEENFDSKSLNESFWNFDLGNGCPDLCGWGNNERQIYTDKNHSLVNGNLVIHANYEEGVYTSTKITTKDKKQFQYGRFEARAKLPVGHGIWPAFWMLGSNISKVGWPKSGEIDILEYIGREPHTIFTSLHTQDSHGETINTKKTKFETIEEGFHIYAMDWTKDKIEFFVDGNSVYVFQPEVKNEDVWPFNQPFYIIVNLAIGGNFGGPKVDNTIFPQDFSIDYIKVYQ
ncbi:MAG: hypothetical protein RL308_925 [Bacteroidota bacterium]|jgi:beta-glucanase (GH16 family)